MALELDTRLRFEMVLREEVDGSRQLGAKAEILEVLPGAKETISVVRRRLHYGLTITHAEKSEILHGIRDILLALGEDLYELNDPLALDNLSAPVAYEIATARGCKNALDALRGENWIGAVKQP